MKIEINEKFYLVRVIYVEELPVHARSTDNTI